MSKMLLYEFSSLSSVSLILQGKSEERFYHCLCDVRGCYAVRLYLGSSHDRSFSIIINQNEKLCWKQKQSIQAEICLNRSISKECGVSTQQRQSVPNQSRISLPWNGGRKRKEFIRCIQSGLPIIREPKGNDKNYQPKNDVIITRLKIETIIH